MPIINVEGVGRVEFPDSMSREQIDSAIKNEILPGIKRQAMAIATQQAALGPNPFSQGTGVANVNYKIGDRYRFQELDLLTKQEIRRRVMTVTSIADDEVTFNEGRLSTDLLGNPVRNANGRNFVERQIFIAEYSIGKKWRTVYEGIGRNGNANEWTIDLKVTKRESITIAAGTFDAFKIEGGGSNRSGIHFQITYWVAPDKVRACLVYEHTRRNRRMSVTDSTRTELVDFRQAG